MAIEFTQALRAVRGGLIEFGGRLLLRRGYALTTKVSGHYRSALVFSLCALFLISFAVPLLFAGKVRDLVFGKRELNFTQHGLDFPLNAGVFSDSGYFLQIKDSSDLDPRRDEDFMIMSWFSLKVLPQLSDRKILFTKIDQGSPTQRGYSLSLVKVKDGVQPVVYWRDNSGHGGSLNFTPFELLPKTWFMFVLTCRKNRYIGLHAMLLRNDGKQELKLLGGYDLEEIVAPWSDGDLVVGAFNAKRVEGKVGPFGVFSGPKLLARIDQILHDVRTAPGTLPSGLLDNVVKLWWTPKTPGQDAHAIPALPRVELRLPDRKRR